MAYRNNCANDNTVYIISTKSLPAMQRSVCNLKMYSTTCTQCTTVVRIKINFIEEEANIPEHKHYCASPKAYLNNEGLSSRLWCLTKLLVTLSWNIVITVG